MKIFICPGHLSGGGIGRNSINLANAFNQRGHEVRPDKMGVLPIGLALHRESF